VPYATSFDIRARSLAFSHACLSCCRSGLPDRTQLNKSQNTAEPCRLSLEYTKPKKKSGQRVQKGLQYVHPDWSMQMANKMESLTFIISGEMLAIIMFTLCV
jgi:hypothetical protein